MSDNRKINYCFMANDNTPRIVVVIKWKKGNLYFIDVNQPWKKSYHSPRDGVSQVHLKVKLKTGEVIAGGPDFCCPINEIKGIRPLGGAGMELDKLPNLPIPNKNDKNYILDTRPFHQSRLSKVQWYHYLVEPGKEKELEKQFASRDDSLKMSEQVAIHTISDSNPLIITEFIRICDENPLWYKK
ncbi:MAG: hypothetical protein WC244_03830 [Patescibacteria group bacterium]|jgi:hypothetical protein